MVFLRSLVGSNRGVVRNAMIGRMGTKDEEEHGDGVEVVGTSNGVEAAHVLTAHYLEEWWGGSGGGGCPPPSCRRMNLVGTKTNAQWLWVGKIRYAKY